MTVVGRVDDGRNRYYVDPTNSDLVYESVTSILSAATAKPWLVPWASKVSAEFAVNHLDEIAQLRAEKGAQAAIDYIKKEAERLRELKADIGTHQHNVLECLLLDAPLPEIPEHLRGVVVDGERVDHDAISDGLVWFLTDFDVRPHMAEATVANVIHGWAGTLDLTGVFPNLRRIPGLPDDLPPNPLGLIDCKSGANIEPTARAQLGAYRRADEVWLPFGQKADMPRVDFAAVLHLRRGYRRGYKLVPIQTDQRAFDWFLQSQKVLVHQREQQKIGKTVVYPPLPDGTQPPTMIEDLDVPDFRCRGALVKAGLDYLNDLANFTVKELLAVRGIGPKAVARCAELLADQGLAFASEPATEAVA